MDYYLIINYVCIFFFNINDESQKMLEGTKLVVNELKIFTSLWSSITLLLRLEDEERGLRDDERGLRGDEGGLRGDEGGR